MIELANTTQGLSTKCWKLIGAKPPGNLDNETKIELSSLQKIQRETIATKILKNEKQKSCYLTCEQYFLSPLIDIRSCFSKNYKNVLSHFGVQGSFDSQNPFRRLL